MPPLVEIGKQAWMVRIPELSAVPGTALRERAGSLARHSDALKRALDILIDGICGFPRCHPDQMGRFRQRI
ncbi:MAG: CcdB family protein, partial [Pararhodobacter sp.]